MRLCTVSSSVSLKTLRMILTRIADIAVNEPIAESIVRQAEDKSVPVYVAIELVLTDRSMSAALVRQTSIRRWISATRPPYTPSADGVSAAIVVADRALGRSTPSERPITRNLLAEPVEQWLRRRTGDNEQSSVSVKR